ncbi:DedA family protein [Bacillus carboniphilus]|uniref:DedA family protein n=1 Tax=Bacillus carboniphilus TaxID=86663 RepID=A0ABY9JQE4_9BACI|nr:DedA family protein [Bacillus carboniphilus]WLR41606.1 DedA family protein [Bacillus carboniphilus]
MENWLINIINEYGYFGILFLIALENIFPPIPSEVILTFGGFITTTSELGVVGVVLSSTVGSVIGALALYGVGRQLDVERLEKVIERWGSFLRLTKNDIYKADSWFDRYGPWAVFFCRFVPLIRSLISIPAGMSNMNMVIFLVLTTLGTLIWNTVLVCLGAFLGSSWEIVIVYMEAYSKIIYFSLILVVVFIVFIYRRKKRK